ncbi:MAG TPA: hypothetical protein VM145_03895 [Sphingomicrobium sp.]|nr:hypothetical protein [Sphingomicrobium sp.]
MKRLLGGCLQAVGILIAGLFGLCTIILFADGNSWQSFGGAAEGLTFTIIPFLLGLGLIWAGRTLARIGREEEL